MSNLLIIFLLKGSISYLWTLLYHPVGGFSSFHTLTTLDFLREREHHNNPGCTSSKASIHTYHIKILGGEGSAAVQDVH